MRRTSEFQRAAPWAVAAGVLAVGAWLLLCFQRSDGEGAGDVLEPLALPHAAARSAEAAQASGASSRAELVPIEAPSTASVSASAADARALPSGLRPEAGERDDTPHRRPRPEHFDAPLADRTAEVLLGEGPDARKIAFLRAIHDAEPEAAGDAFGMAIRELEVRSSPHSSSVPEFALSHLGERAAEDAGARDLLRAVTFGPMRAASLSLRRRAAVHLGRTSTGPELEALAAELRGERDELVRAGFAAGLLSNREERLVQLLYSDLLAARDALAGDGDLHQEPESR